MQDYPTDWEIFMQDFLAETNEFGDTLYHRDGNAYTLEEVVILYVQEQEERHQMDTLGKL